MPIFLQSKDFPLSIAEVRSLWRETITHRSFSDDQVNIKCVLSEEMRTLNKQYQGKDAATNVLTFNYAGEHDVVLGLDVARREAQERGIKVRNYVALLLVHAFLHATGMDHERSEAEAQETEKAEHAILQAAGFAAAALSA